MEAGAPVRLLPYSLVVGQDRLKRALELAHVAPGVGGVLVSGQRGTAKSTVVRAFARMVHGDLPVTLPINATDDRVVGGWRFDELMRGEPAYQRGLLEEAGERGMLYIDEVNLLDDHIVNLILDVASTGILSVQREMLARQVSLAFTLVGTMNPEEGGLRPQLLDRFGLIVPVKAEEDRERRRRILETVLRFDECRRDGGLDPWLAEGLERDAERARALEAARARVYDVRVPPEIAAACAALAESFQLAGHRGDYVTALAARAEAALEGAGQVGLAHVARVAPMALAHRSPEALRAGTAEWSNEQEASMRKLLASA